MTRKLRAQFDLEIRGLMDISAKARREMGLACRCGLCGENVKDDRVLVALIDGRPNMFMHYGCVPDDVQAEFGFDRETGVGEP